MFENRVPQFNKGRILKNSMLDCLRDFPRDALRITLQDYSNGVVYGGNILVNKEILLVQPCILKHQGKLYLIEQEYPMEYRPTDQWTGIYAKFTSDTKSPDFDACTISIIFDDDLSFKQDRMELARFKLKQGAWLRYDYQDLEDFTTEYNTFNYVHVEYAAPGESTVCPELLRYFAHEVLIAGSENALDMAFALDCLNNGRISRQSILFYISNKLNEIYKAYTNEEIHKKLVLILRDIQKHAVKRKRAPKDSGVMLVD